MYQPRLFGWRWILTPIFPVVLAISFNSDATPCSAQSVSDVEVGRYCALHGPYQGVGCPKCRELARQKGGTSSGSQRPSLQNQIAIDAAGQLGAAIGQMIRGDPQQAARERAAAEARALEQQRIDAERERKKQEDFTRLRSTLKLDTFDGDHGELLLKGVDVASAGDAASKPVDSGNELGLKLGDDELKPQGTQAAGNTGAPEAATPNTDPMVVDARDVLSGLPKSVEDAIPQTPAGNRVRKGFQAIADHDWNTALLWFKDAFNREPGDPELRRLVDLAQFTLDSQARAQLQAAGSNSIGAQAVAVPVEASNHAQAKQPPTEASSIAQAGTTLAEPDISAFDPAALESGKIKAVINTRESAAARIAANRMAIEARVTAVYDELLKQYGPNMKSYHRYSLETNMKKQKAMDGEGMSKEELNAQFERALTEYLIAHPIRYEYPLGPATAEEITLGGKG